MKLCAAQLTGRTRQEGKCHLGSQTVQALGLAIIVGVEHPSPKTLLFP